MSIQKDVFGFIVGEENKDWYVLQTLPDGSRECVTSLNRQPKPSTTQCSATTRGLHWSFGGHRCSKVAVETCQEKRYVKTTSSRYGEQVYTFILAADGRMIGEPEMLEEEVTVGYCGTHSPTRIADRERKKDEQRMQEWRVQQKRETEERKAKLTNDAKALNYSFVELRARKVIDLMMFGVAADTLTKDQLSMLQALREQLDQLPLFIKAGVENYGISSYMIGADGKVKKEYVK